MVRVRTAATQDAEPAHGETNIAFSIFSQPESRSKRLYPRPTYKGDVSANAVTRQIQPYHGFGQVSAN
jgi:hypothetical protein